MVSEDSHEYDSNSSKSFDDDHHEEEIKSESGLSELSNEEIYFQKKIGY